MDQKAQTGCFSGYRPEKMPFTDAQGIAIPQALYRPLLSAVQAACHMGCFCFITGMSRGFDLWAAQAVLLLRREDPRISLWCAIPYEGQETSWAAPWRTLYRNVRAQSDRVIVLSAAYFPQCFYARNRFMVDASSRLICYFDGQKGGTRHTFEYATKSGLLIQNLADRQLCLDCIIPSQNTI